MSDSRLVGAVAVNVLLTLAQIVSGIVSGSLSLIADALHNLNDAASLALALVARKLGRRPADRLTTFGYGQAEVVARPDAPRARTRHRHNCERLAFA